MESQAVDLALAQPISDGVRFADCPIGEVVDTSGKESKPEAALRWISGNRHRVVLMPQPGPGNLLHFFPIPYAHKAGILVGNPQIAVGIFGNRMHSSPTDCTHRDEALLL